MDTTRERAVSNRVWIRASKEAASALAAQEKDGFAKQQVIIFHYLPLNLSLLYLMGGHLSTRKILPYSFWNIWYFCAEPTKAYPASRTALHSLRTVDKIGTQVAAP